MFVVGRDVDNGKGIVMDDCVYRATDTGVTLVGPPAPGTDPDAVTMLVIGSCVSKRTILLVEE